MDRTARQYYNHHFSREKFQSFMADLSAPHGAPGFRMAETPVFVPPFFLKEMLHTCEFIVDEIVKPVFIEKTNAAIPRHLHVPGETAHPDFIAFDFGVCSGSSGQPTPMLIEMQAFPTLFAYQLFVEQSFARHLQLPENYTTRLNGITDETYTTLLRSLILNGHQPQHVILLDIHPQQQKTKIDFDFTKDLTGIETVCVTQLQRSGRQLFYKNHHGENVEVKRIYNRIIFDELLQQGDDVQQQSRLLFEELDVEWASHPHWFYRVSKYTLPLLQHPNIPATKFLSSYNTLPPNLENYVLKPLFSFAGQGVIMDVTTEDITNIPDPQNWILQQKATYLPVIETPDEPAKAEIRIFYFWPNGAPRPIAVKNLARISKSHMIGVRYNTAKSWTGGSFCLFEK